jgi:thiosulfate/3-mercaptopyruvate sulfurtransferase
VLPEKKVWVHDGRFAQFPENFLASTHGELSCTTCHGGVGTAGSRSAAHAGTWQPIPGSDVCAGCHGAIVTSAQGSLHTTIGGYVRILSDRGFDFTPGTESRARFDEQCAKCHIANDEGRSACGHCHVSVPNFAGGGLLNGHNFRKTPDMERNCTACHGSRVKDEFFGLNNHLIENNRLGLAPVQPDVHFAKTQELNADGYPKGCTFCHSGQEMHGVGAPAAGTDDRYAVASAPSCEGCHGNLVESNSLHRASHLSAMACQSCHAQAYKNCFGCHTDIDVGNTGLPYYRINQGDPTLAVRPEGSMPDALMTFRIGKNPRADKPYKFAVLRHAPIDRDVFRYPRENPIDGLIPNLTALPTWKYATPHNIQRNVAGLASSTFATFNPSRCGNCHAPDYRAYWLTDAVEDAKGWVPAAYHDDQRAANASVIQPTQIRFDTSN